MNITGWPMTHKQKQCCLAALGLYPADLIDGIWGSRSEKAQEAFRQQYPTMTLGQAVKALEGKGEDFWGNIRHFRREEFHCRCGGKYCDGFPAEPSQTLVELADDLREQFHAPAIPSSGLRCSRHNANVGGVANSRHLSGKALDFYIQGVSGQQLLAAAQADPRTRYAYIIDSGPYVHMDVT